jgi:tetratricopeptide (TPR) repeat protein
MPDEAEYYFQAGDQLEKLDSLAKALPYYSDAIKLDPENFHYPFQRGTNYLKQEKFKLAINDFNLALKNNPEHDNSLHNRAIALYKIGKMEQACIDWCQALLKGNPKSASHLQRNCKTIPSDCLLSKSVQKK